MNNDVLIRNTKTVQLSHLSHIKKTMRRCSRLERLGLLIVAAGVVSLFVSLSMMFPPLPDGTTNMFSSPIQLLVGTRSSSFKEGLLIQATIPNAIITTQDPNSDAVQVNGLSVIISVFRQPKCLRQMVRYLQTCDVVKEIRINWFDDTTMLQTLPSDYFFVDSNASTTAPLLYNKTPIHFDVLPNNITHRFSPRRDPPLLSSATFHVDVDTFYSCQALSFAFHTWTLDYKSDPQVVVGFHPRFLLPRKYYQFSESYSRPFRHNTVFVTKGAIVHSIWMNMFFSDTRFQKWRDRMDVHITAEDMLMSFFLAQHSVRTVPLCVNVHDTCSITCAQGQQKTLAQRTADVRPKLLQELFQSFGEDLLVAQQGSQSMRWSNQTLESWNHRCYSVAPNQHSIASANRKCLWFCNHTPVCPENPRRRDPTNVWD